MKSAEGRGRTLDEAVDAALIELGETRRNVILFEWLGIAHAAVEEVIGIG